MYVHLSIFLIFIIIFQVMGLSNGVHWTAWFITSLLFMTISVFLLAVLAKAGQILTNSNPVIVFWMLTSFAIATISMSFFISVFFSKANISAACGGIIYFFTYLPYSLTVWFEDQMTYSYKILAVRSGHGVAFHDYFNSISVLFISTKLLTVSKCVKNTANLQKEKIQKII